jgi:outer membrane protein assembly factor BamB
LVWAGHATGRGAQEPDFTVARDLRTGQIVKEIQPEEAFTAIHHHRCYRNRATDRYIMLGRTGIEFIHLASGEAMRHNWVRGACQYGIVPCNGLLYAPPHSCACYVQSKINGFWALASKRESQSPRIEESKCATKATRLEEGPAYPAVKNQKSEARDGERAPSRAADNLISDLRPLNSGEDWPTYRHNAARNGRTETSVPPEVAPLWCRTVGERLSSPVVAGGRVFAAAVDEHTVHCLDAATGKDLWRYVADGRVDSPPTCSGGLVVFGAADGCVYCLRADDGALAWRYRAAPRDERVVSYGRLESPWPVHGSVLVQDGAVYCAAGRSSYLDDGICLYRLDLATGKVLAHRRLWSRDATGRQPEDKVVVMEMAGFLPDVLSSDGDRVYMRHAGFAPEDLRDSDTEPHLMSVSGLLDGNWWHRSYWVFGTLSHSCCWGAMTAMREAPTGRIMAFDDTTLYGYGRQYWEIKGLAHTRPNPHHLWAIRKGDWPEQTPAARRQDFTERARSKTRITLEDFTWSTAVPVHARAMVLAGKTLFIAGPPELQITEEDMAHSPTGIEHRQRVADQTLVWRGMMGALLCAVSTKDGAMLFQVKLDSLPVWDGLIAAKGRLYMSTATGEVLCLGEVK